MARLTKELQNAIAVRLLKDRFGAEEQALQERALALADEVYQIGYASAVESHPACPSDRVHYLAREPGSEWFRCRIRRMSQSRLVPITMLHNDGLLKLEPGSELSEREAGLCAASRELQSRKQMVEFEIKLSLGSYKTIEKLLKNWPDLAPIIEEELKYEPGNQ